jgi:hypothetical protein
VGGCLVTDRRARQALTAGLAGDPRRLPGVHLYESNLVEELAARCGLTDGEVDAACPHGLFVARRGDLRDHGWRFSPWTWVWIRSRIERHGHLPMVATLAGFVVAGADIRDASTSGTLSLVGPGDWFEALARRRLSTGPGRDWWIRGLDRPRPARNLRATSP